MNQHPLEIQKRLKNSDPEIDEDENGDAYPAIEYWYKDGNCQFSIRIDMENKSMARTKSGGCEQGLTLESVAILKKKDVKPVIQEGSAKARPLI